MKLCDYFFSYSIGILNWPAAYFLSLFYTKLYESEVFAFISYGGQVLTELHTDIHSLNIPLTHVGLVRLSLCYK